MNTQHSTPVNAPLMGFQNGFQGNQFTPYGPQGPQSQFAGYVSPISSQQPQADIVETLRVMSDRLEHK